MLLSTVKGKGMGKATDVVQGTLDVLILKVISRDPQHGWAIAQRIRQLSDEVLTVQQGSLYPALQRLERQGWITAEWGASDNNRRARYYKLTAAGTKQLANELSQFERIMQAIGRVLEPA